MHEAFEARETLEVEIVRRLVEEDNVEPRLLDCSQAFTCGLSARQLVRGGLLCEIADRQVRRRAAHRSGVRLFETGEDPQQRRLARAVRADETDARAVSDDDRHVLQDDLRTVVLGDVRCNKRRQTDLLSRRKRETGMTRLSPS
jgi:hypothetical protein